jgi:hypothetical protein
MDDVVVAGEASKSGAYSVVLLFLLESCANVVVTLFENCSITPW